MDKLRMFRKKGSYQMGNLFQYILLTMFIIVGAFFVFLFILGKFRTDILYTKSGIDQEILISRFYYSPTCFAYNDPEIMRSYPFIIDANKFTKENLDSCMQSPLAYNITLYRDKYKRSIQSSNWDGKFTDSYSKKVLVYDNRLYNGTMMIQVDDEVEDLRENKVTEK